MHLSSQNYYFTFLETKDILSVILYKMVGFYFFQIILFVHVSQMKASCKWPF